MSKLNLFNAARRRSGVIRFFSGLAATAVLATSAVGLTGCDEGVPAEPASLMSIPDSTTPESSPADPGATTKEDGEKARQDQRAEEQKRTEEAARLQQEAEERKRAEEEAERKRLEEEQQRRVEEDARQQQANSLVSTPQPAQNVYYKNCREAREAGAAPLHRGEPGYRDKLDRDGDGVACE